MRKIEICAKMEALFKKPKQEVDHMAIEIISPFLDVTDLGTVNPFVEMSILWWMSWNELYHVVSS